MDPETLWQHHQHCLSASNFCHETNCMKWFEHQYSGGVWVGMPHMWYMYLKILHHMLWSKNRGLNYTLVKSLGKWGVKTTHLYHHDLRTLQLHGPLLRRVVPCKSQTSLILWDGEPDRRDLSVCRRHAPTRRTMKWRPVTAIPQNATR